MSIPWFGPELGAPEREAVARVLASGYINDGAVVRDLETAIAARVGTTYCVAVTSGTAAIALALMALGVGAGDEVIVPDLTFAATANAVRLTGATVHLVDVDPERFTIDPLAVERAIGPRTKAVVPVDVNGRAADYERLAWVCVARGLAMVCDSAEAFGSRYADGRALGTLGDAGAFSFSPNKTVTAGQGGAIVTQHRGMYERLLELKDQGRRNGGTGGDDMHPTVGFNFKMTNVQAAIALAQLGRLDHRLAHFALRDKWYREALRDVPNVDVPPARDGEVLQWRDVLCKRRTLVKNRLAAAGVECRAFWRPLHTQQPYYDNTLGCYSNSDNISQRGLWLPSHFSLTQFDVQRVAALVRATQEECTLC